MDILPEVVDVVKGRVPIIIDGGFYRGTDVIKAIAMGATAVGLGRLYCYALAAAGRPGIVRMLELLEDEIRRDLGLMGCDSIKKIDKSYVCAMPPVGPAERVQRVQSRRRAARAVLSALHSQAAFAGRRRLDRDAVKLSAGRLRPRACTCARRRSPRPSRSAPPAIAARASSNGSTRSSAKRSAEGVSQRTIAAASHLMVYDQSVVNKDRGQKVFSQTFLEFSDRMVAKHRIDGGIQRIAKNRPLFQQVEQQFGVPAPVIAAFWALETDFGGFMGNLPTIKSVTSLAYDCRRPDLFRTQLLATLKIIERGDLAADQMIGPFAGELGQFQFLPAHYFDYGVDYDGDGRRDLIRSAPDAVASAANYLSKIGWKRGQPWLEEVRVAGADGLGAGRSRDPASARAMGALGRDAARTAARSPRTRNPPRCCLPMGRFGPAFLAYPNFQVFLEWNQSIVYSTSAAYLATRINGAPAMKRGTGQIVPFASAQIRELQQLLARRGHDVGKIDGFLGAKSRAAVKAEQIKLGLPADSYPTPELVRGCREDRSPRQQGQMQQRAAARPPSGIKARFVACGSKIKISSAP